MKAEFISLNTAKKRIKKLQDLMEARQVAVDTDLWEIVVNIDQELEKMGEKK